MRGRIAQNATAGPYITDVLLSGTNATALAEPGWQAYLFEFTSHAGKTFRVIAASPEAAAKKLQRGTYNVRVAGRLPRLTEWSGWSPEFPFKVPGGPIGITSSLLGLTPTGAHMAASVVAKVTRRVLLEGFCMSSSCS